MRRLRVERFDDPRIADYRNVRDADLRNDAGLFMTEGRLNVARLLALYRLEVLDQSRVLDDVRDRPIYLGLGSTADKRVRVKPQNLLMNLPLRGADS